MSDQRHDLPTVLGRAAPVRSSTLHSAPGGAGDARQRRQPAAKRFLNFFAASIENDNTRMAYYRAVCSFFAWLDQHGIGELPDIELFHVAAYLKALTMSEPGDRSIKQRVASKPTVNQHLAAIRMLFD